MGRISREIGHSTMEMFELILEFVRNFNVDRLLFAIKMKRCGEDDIESITLDVRTQHLRLEKQKAYLDKISPTFNKEYAHYDNKCFDTSVKMARKIRSGTAGVKNVFKRFCKKITRTSADNPNPQAHEQSMICTAHYICDMFGISNYPPCVKTLFEEMLKFYGDLDECIDGCMTVIEGEKIQRADKEGCLAMLTDAKEKSRKAQIHIIEEMENNPELKEAIIKSKGFSKETNPVLKAYREAEDKEAFAAEYYHNCTPRDINVMSLSDAALEANDDPEMLYALTLFDGDKQHVLHVNYAIEHFDDLLPEKCKRGKIPAMHLYFFMKWCKPSVGTQSFLKYFDKRYKKHDGKWETIGYSAISGANTKETKNKKESEKIKKDMMERLDEMLSEAFPEEQIITSQEKTA